MLFLGGVSDKWVLIVVVTSDWSDDDNVGDEQLLGGVILLYSFERDTLFVLFVWM